MYVSDLCLNYLFYGCRLRSIREVSRSVYESCDLAASYVAQWTPPNAGGQRLVWLSSGQTHYFIDTVVSGCLEGRKLRVSEKISWQFNSF